jgi:hypothetical protein
MPPPLQPEIYCTVAQASAAWPKFAKLVAQEQADLIADASAAVQQWCRRQILEQTYTETYDGTGLGRIWLNVRPVIAVAAVLINGDPVDNTYGTAWYFKADTGELGRGSGQDDRRFQAWFPRGSRNIQVTYAAGYQTVPNSVKRATIFVVRWLYDSGRQSWAMSSETIGDYSYTLNPMLANAPLPPPAISLLTPYVQDDGPL